MTESAQAQPDTQAEWRCILVGVDHSELADLALTRALELAVRHAAVLHIVQAIAPLTPLTAGVPAMMPGIAAPATVGGPAAEAVGSAASADQDIADQLRERVSLAAEGVHGAKLIRTVYHVRRGSPSAVIRDVASDINADLVVLGTHGRSGFERMLLGSVSESVVRSVHCTALLVRPKEHQRS